MAKSIVIPHARAVAEGAHALKRTREETLNSSYRWDRSALIPLLFFERLLPADRLKLKEFLPAYTGTVVGYRTDGKPAGKSLESTDPRTGRKIILEGIPSHAFVFDDEGIISREVNPQKTTRALVFSIDPVAIDDQGRMARDKDYCPIPLYHTTLEKDRTIFTPLKPDCVHVETLFGGWGVPNWSTGISFCPSSERASKAVYFKVDGSSSYVGLATVSNGAFDSCYIDASYEGDQYAGVLIAKLAF
ncbi:MAG: hypothetical protein ABIH99_01985 [Candidatus Micrarchaeota archaeon]